MRNGAAWHSSFGGAFSIPSRTALDTVLAVALWAAAACIAAIFAWIMGDILWNGAGQISWAFFAEAPQRAGRAGGIAPIIASTVLILGVCLAVAIPLGLATALLLAEFTRSGGWTGGLIRGSLDVLAGVPSIVFGLFGNAFFCITLGLGFSILSGGLTLACMVLPLLIRSIEMGLRAVPDDYRLAAAALSISRTRLTFHVLLPAAAPSLAAGLVLGIGRALAETAALIFTSGYVDRMPRSLLDSGRALPVHIYDLAMNIPGGEPNAWASALVLVMALLAINLIARVLMEQLLNRRITNA